MEYEHIKTTGQLVKEYTEAKTYRKELQLTISTKVTRLNMMERILENVKMEYQFRANRTDQSMTTLRKGLEDTVLVLDEMKAVRAQTEADRAQMGRVKSRHNQIQHEMDERLNSKVLDNLLQLTQRKNQKK